MKKRKIYVQGKIRTDKLLTPEAVAKINPLNLKLLYQYEEYMLATGRSQNTVKAYVIDLKITFVWSSKRNDNKSFVDWKVKDLSDLQEWLIGKNGNDRKRVLRIRIALRSLAKYVETILDEEYPGFRNLLDAVPPPVKLKQIEDEPLTKERVETLLRYLTEGRKYDRACAVALIFYSGRKQSDIPFFKIGDFCDDNLVCNNEVYKIVLSKTLPHSRKVVPVNCIVLARQFTPYLKRWIKEREKKHIKSEYLFPGRNTDVGITCADLTSWQGYCEDLLCYSFSWQALRDLSALNLKRAGLPISVVRRYMDDGDITMVPTEKKTGIKKQLKKYYDNEEPPANGTE